MTDREGESSALDEHLEGPAAGGGHRRKAGPGRRLRGCLPVLLVIAVLAVLAYVGITRGADYLRDQFADPEDYPGPGTGKVTFEVVSGDSIAQMGRNLKAEGIVASVEAFTNAASGDPCAPNIQA